MNKTLSNILIFAAGVAIGSAVTYKIFKDKYDFEYEEVVEAEDSETVEEKDDDDEYFEYEEPPRSSLDDDREENVRIIDGHEYHNYAAVIKKDTIECDDGSTITIEKGVEHMEPYVIPPEEFGEDPDYDTTSLTYFNDGVVADDYDNELSREYVDEIIGLDSLDHFGEYEDDSVFVKNEIRQEYFEILADERNYADLEKPPYEGQ